MQKILLIGSELGKGGAERSISLLSYYLSLHFDVTLCLLSGTERCKYYPTCAKVLFVDPPQAGSLWQKAKAWRFRIKAIKAIKQQTGCDICISFLEGPNYVNVLTKGREKVYASVRGSHRYDAAVSGLFGWLRKKWLIPILYAKADKVICASSQLAGEMETHFHIPKTKLNYIYNLFDIAHIQDLMYEPLHPEEALIFKKPVIISCGRLHPQKNQQALIAAFAALRRQQDARLVLLGDGALKQQLAAFAAQHGLQVCDFIREGSFRPADVYFMGYQSNPFKFYRHSRVFALSSNWEGFPNVLAEALICRLPVVAADCATGPREILNIALKSTASANRPHRAAAGSLMPLLSIKDDRAVACWVAELAYWLAAPRPTAAEFEALTLRFQKEEIMERWNDFIGVSESAFVT